MNHDEHSIFTAARFRTNGHNAVCGRIGGGVDNNHAEPPDYPQICKASADPRVKEAEQ